jgi:REP element-mobilizing transposase RayT
MKPVKKRGGRRSGAGRKRSKERWQDPRHSTRESLDYRHPVHVMLRTRESVPELRQRRNYEAIRKTLVRYVNGRDFRIVHISIQQNHLHLIVEASDAEKLTRGMQSFAINCARAINRAWDRSGKVFKFRYKAKQIRDCEYARNVISYVLNNWRRHRQDFANGRELTAILDEYSSAISFTGWKGNRRWKIPPGHVPLPVSPPRTALLKSDWQRFGLIDPYEMPGPLW